MLSLGHKLSKKYATNGIIDSEYIDSYAYIFDYIFNFALYNFTLILIGFILLFIAMLDIIIFPYHPTFYKILIFLTFFPFSWIGGKITEVIYERKKKRLKKLQHKKNATP